MYTDNLFGYQPYWSVVPPYYVGDVLPDPYRVGDFPIHKDKKREDDYQKSWAEIIKRLQNTPVVTNFDRQVWFNNADGNGQIFRLEVVGYGQEHISAEIKDSTLCVSGKRGQKSFSQQFKIPSPEKLDLANVSARVEYGLLEINFASRKSEVKSVKIL